MLRNTLLIALCLMLAPAVVWAQLYSPYTYNAYTIHRPTGLKWKQIKTDHFRVIYPDGEDSLAYRSAAILESSYPKASKLTGGSLSNFPVILNNYNYRSNGFVTSMNFRSEIDLAAMKGKGMNPKSGDWLETVLPHELVHATHFNVQQPAKNKKASIPNFISLFSPDMARSFHGLPPVGMHEGLAVYYETESVAPGGGRGNYSFFNNRFNANFGSTNRWNMGQTLIPSNYTRPFNRHYIAGYTFMDWLHVRYGDSISKKAIRNHYHNFFLGYGFALRQKTGKWPGQLYALYEQDLAEQEADRLSNITVNTTEKSQIIDPSFKGDEMHAPKWLSENTLLFYGSFYNARVGFYRYNLDEQRARLISEVYGTDGYDYEITENNNVLFSNYQQDAKFSGVFTTDLQLLNVENGKYNRLTKNAQVYAPATNGEQVLALQSDGAGAQIVQVEENGELTVLKKFKDAIPISLAFNPKNPKQLAVIVKQRGVQALWITTTQNLADDLDLLPDLAFKNASVFDVEWHPNGQKFLFSMDAESAMNIFEYDLSTQQTTQLTGSLYNAFEASYSPDGNKIAYVLQSESDRKVAILDRRDFVNRQVPEQAFLRGDELRTQLQRPLLGSELIGDISPLTPTNYRADFRWLKPRAIYPVVEEHAGTYQYGAGISSIDPLSSQAYSIEVTGIQDRLWYDATYTNKMFYPGFELSAYSEPQFFATKNPNTDQNFSLMQQERGFSLGSPFNYIFRGDTRLTSIYLSPKISAEQIKYYNLQAQELSDFSTRYKASIFSQLSLGVLNLPRSVQPAAGLSLFGLYEQTLNEPEYDIHFPGSSTPTRYRFSEQWSAYYGMFGFLSPLRRWNQSLRLDLQFLQQSASPIYSNSTIVPMGFNSDEFPNFNSGNNEGFQHLGRLSARYTIPLFYPDNGGLLLPLYFSSIYLTAFSHTLTNMEAANLVDSSRSIFGGGLHVQFKVSNLLFDLGVGFAYEPTRNQSQFIFGQF